MGCHKNRLQADSKNGVTDENSLSRGVPRPLIATTIVMMLIPAATSVHRKARARRSALEVMYLIVPHTGSSPT